MSVLRRGLVAGAAGTTALTVVGWLDMVWRGRAPSGMPAQVVEQLADRLGVEVGGSSEERASRLDALGALSGIATGLALGVAASVAHAAGLRPPLPVGGAVVGAAAMLATDVPAAGLEVTDLRTWSDADWASDLVPHLAYGVATSAVLAAWDRRDAAAPTRGSSLRPARVPPLALRAFLLGFASGGRSAAGIAALALGTPARSQRLHWLSNGPATGLAVVASVGELVVDKLPGTPSRLEPPVLGGRLVTGAGAGALLARREQRAMTVPTLLGAVGALAGSFAGARWRSASAPHRPDWIAALAEDGIVLLLTSYAVRALPVAEPLTGRERADALVVI